MDTIERTTGAVGQTFALRPGVLMPDWSLTTEPTARDALAASMVAAQRAEKWSDLSAAEDRVWRAVLRGFAHSGAAPDMARLAAGTGLAEPTVAEILRALRRRDLVVLEERGTAVTAAYPFSARETGHRVRLDKLAVVYALCAIDALGMGAMLSCDTAVESSCPECGVPIQITMHDKGRALASAAPATAVVWAGIRYADECGATSGCTVKLFFCTNEHLVAWRHRVDPGGAGFQLSMEAALQVGKGLFVPMLAPRSEEDGA
ncbi:organomercurial lyase [Paeniroseomonas aquatica]|uniref:Organomercurial lyase n=1 Tax=Paeniroseomonas aquatica TaxID=373043 RepID=A0ABT8A2V9_9PROT|nr:organomercurial lyase [Paeniroseomonas aquatica]MDN3564098.1 organomercurial lyase [Paeniroseomonas aquatica]